MPDPARTGLTPLIEAKKRRPELFRPGGQVAGPGCAPSAMSRPGTRGISESVRAGSSRDDREDQATVSGDPLDRAGDPGQAGRRRLDRPGPVPPRPTTTTRIVDDRAPRPPVPCPAPAGKRHFAHESPNGYVRRPITVSKVGCALPVTQPGTSDEAGNARRSALSAVGPAATSRDRRGLRAWHRVEDGPKAVLHHEGCTSA
jgi:hypothetical protein